MKLSMTASRRNALLATLLGATLAAPATADRPEELFERFQAFDVAALDVPADKPEAFTVDVTIDRELRQLDLTRISVHVNRSRAGKPPGRHDHHQERLQLAIS